MSATVPYYQSCLVEIMMLDSYSIATVEMCACTNALVRLVTINLCWQKAHVREYSWACLILDTNSTDASAWQLQEVEKQLHCMTWQDLPMHVGYNDAEISHSIGFSYISVAAVEGEHSILGALSALPPCSDAIDSTIASMHILTSLAQPDHFVPFHFYILTLSFGKEGSGYIPQCFLSGGQSNWEQENALCVRVWSLAPLHIRMCNLARADADGWAFVLSV